MGIDVTRIAGADRYETSVKVAAKIGSVDTAVIATGENFPDALAGSALAALNQAPIILVSNVLSSASKNFLSDQDVGSIVAFGGSGVISDSVLRSLESVVFR